MISTMTRYQMLQTNPALTKSLTQNDAMVKRDTEYYQANISKVKTIDEFVKDYRLFNYAMKAYGLEDMIYAKAFIKKLLHGGCHVFHEHGEQDDGPALQGIRQGVRLCRERRQGDLPSQRDHGSRSKYYQQTLENKEGEQNEGVRFALYFKRKAIQCHHHHGTSGGQGPSEVRPDDVQHPGASIQGGSRSAGPQPGKAHQHQGSAGSQEGRQADPAVLRHVGHEQRQHGADCAVLTLFSEPTEAGISVDLMMSITKLRLGGL